MASWPHRPTVAPQMCSWATRSVPKYIHCGRWWYFCINFDAFAFTSAFPKKSNKKAYWCKSHFLHLSMSLKHRDAVSHLVHYITLGKSILGQPLTILKILRLAYPNSPLKTAKIITWLVNIYSQPDFCICGWQCISVLIKPLGKHVWHEAFSGDWHVFLPVTTWTNASFSSCDLSTLPLDVLFKHGM